jgi:hypothetical protein
MGNDLGTVMSFERFNAVALDTGVALKGETLQDETDATTR